MSETLIRKYVYGSPIETDAVVCSIPVTHGDPAGFNVTRSGDGCISFARKMGRNDIVFGLGEQVRGMNKRGHKYCSFNTDEPHHTEDRNSLYAAHNFLLFPDGDGYLGVFFDDPGEVTFDLGYTMIDDAVITSRWGNLYVYTIEGETRLQVVKAFRGLIGRSYIPPRWAFGYNQSRWGYASAEDVRRVAEGHRSRHIPLDMVTLDIDYMERFKDFTVGKEQVPDLKALSEEMKKQGLRIVPIIDAGVKVEEGYPVYDEGIANGYFAAREDGTPFVGAVWPGHACFPDFLRPEVRQWFGDWYRVLLDAGVEGFWNDMNEPAIFYSKEGLQKAIAKAVESQGKNLDVYETWGLTGLFTRMANSMDDYQSFYHQVDGKPVRHDKVHNLFGYNMTRAAAEGMKRYAPEKRHLLFSRSSYIGAHRYGGIWQGDNNSWWSHLLLNLKMMPSLNMVGFLYTGADLGGFGCDTTEDLVLRWLELGIFTPIMRNHCVLSNREQEIYQFSTWEDMRNIVTVRYALLPWLYSEFMQAALEDGMMFRPLAFDYPQDEMACRTEDQVMLGEGCMLAPVVEQNACGRHVYLPEDMLLVRFRSSEDYDLIPMHKGHHWVELALNEAALFIRKGCVIPMARSAECSADVDSRTLTMLGWIDGDAACRFYDDDGMTADPQLAEGLHTLQIKVAGGKAEACCEGFVLDAGKIVVG